MNVFQIVILVGLIQGLIYIGILLLFKPLRSKANMYLAFLILAFVGNLGQYWARDVGLITTNVTQFIFLPWQILVPPLFLLYIVELRIFKIDYPNKWVLFLPVTLVLLIHFSVKIQILMVGIDSWFKPAWVSLFYLCEEYLSMSYGLIVAVVVFRIICLEKKQNRYRGFGLNKTIVKAINVMVFFAVLICLSWFISVSIFHTVYPVLSTYYILWTLMVIVLNFMGINGICNSLTNGPMQILYGFGENVEVKNTSSLIKMSTPKQFYNRSQTESLVDITNELGDATDQINLQNIFIRWLKTIYQTTDVEFGLHGCKDNKSMAKIATDGTSIYIPCRDKHNELLAFTVRNNIIGYFEEEHLYYLKMAAKAYSYHHGRIAGSKI